MINILDFALFRLINDYARLHIFDLALPILANMLFFISFAVFMLIVFAIICKKVYGNFFWRLVALTLLCSSTIAVSYASSYFWKDTFERPRPIANLSQILYFDQKDDKWVKTERFIANSEAVVHEEQDLSNSENQQENNSGADDLAQKVLVEHFGIMDNALFYEKKTFTSDQLLKEQNEYGFSMPSNMASCSMAIALIIALLLPKTNPWIYIFPLVIGWARVYAGYSFPLDIIVGWIWGILCVAITWLICDFILRKFSKTRKLQG